MSDLSYIVLLLLLGMGSVTVPFETPDGSERRMRTEDHAGPHAAVIAVSSPRIPPRGTPPRVDTTHRDTTSRDTTSRGTVSQATSPEATSPEAGAWQEEAWNEIAVVRGVQFAYLYYIEADNVNDGVVVRLHNRSDCPATVDFDVIFRAASRSGEGRERVVEESYRLAPGERKTGENDGLFYIPFPEGDSIAEVGLRGVSVRTICR